MKVVATGYREWGSADSVFRVLDEVFKEPQRGFNYNILACGDCPDGADAYIKYWATRLHPELVMFLEFEAHWTDLGNRAGPVRNNAMLSMIRPDLVVAFLHPKSRGAKGCHDEAVRRHIPVFPVWA